MMWPQLLLERNPCCPESPVPEQRLHYRQGGRASLAPGHNQDRQGATTLGEPADSVRRSGDRDTTGRTPSQHRSLLVSGERVCHGAVGGRRKARRESCVLGQVLPAPCAFAPRFRLEPCGDSQPG